MPDFLEIGTEAMVTTQPTDLYLYDEGNNIVITADVTPQTGVIYQWEMSSDDGNAWISIVNDTINNTIFSGANTSTLNCSTQFFG